MPAMTDDAPSRRRRHFEPGDPYAEGADAASAHRPMTTNPYRPETREWQLWRDGYLTVDEDWGKYNGE